MNIDTAIIFIKDRNEKGLSYLYDHYSAALLGIIVRIVGSEELGEEVLQHTFLKIWSKMDTYDSSKSTIFTWMARIARNTAIDQTRLKRTENLKNTFSIDDQEQAMSVSNHFSGLDAEKLIKILDHKYKVVLDHIYLKGFSQKETAELLDIPIGTVKTRLKKSIEILRETLKEEKPLFTSGLFLILLLILMLCK